jgi:hypothetical protein
MRKVLIIAIAATSALAAAYYYFRPPRIKPLSQEAVRNVVRIANREERPLE